MRPAVFIPLFLFLALAGIFFISLKTERNPQAIPSALLNKPVPQMELVAIPGLGSVPALSSEQMRKGIFFVNIWASWCKPCRDEHPILMQIADMGIPVLGINHKDAPENARNFLELLGNPFRAVGYDSDGRASIQWGGYGVPESFIVKDGIIRYKHVGPITSESFARQIQPKLEALANE